MLIFECVANKEKFVQEDACVCTPKSDAADKMYKSVPIQGYIQAEQRTQKMLCFSALKMEFSGTEDGRSDRTKTLHMS